MTADLKLELASASTDCLKPTVRALLSENDLVQEIMTNVAVLKASISRALWSCVQPQELIDLLYRLQERLRNSQARLPHRDQIFQFDHDHLPLRTTIYYAHLLHMGATMLVFRRCLSVFRLSKDRAALSSEQRDVLNRTLENGLLAAQQTAQVLCIVRKASQSVRHCWITM
jgi:hypothetical protein